MLQLYFCPLYLSFSNRCIKYFLKPKHAVIRDFMIDEYTGTGENYVKNRDGFTEMLGDMIYTIPAIKTANAHRGIYTTY